MIVAALATTPIFMQKFINTIWYQKNILKFFLWPFSLLYIFIIFIRKFFYTIQLFKSHKINVPVIIVGNVTVGGTGKTPFVIALVNELKKQGFHPAVISRGYGGKSKLWPVFVDKNSDPALVGDEGILIAKKTGVPVIVGPDRVKNAFIALNGVCARTQHDIDVIVSDDGLQHYALARDIEIAVIDGARQFGNGFCLPAGPLREPVSRLKSVDSIVINGAIIPDAIMYTSTPTTTQFVIDEIVNIHDELKKLNPVECNHQKIIAIAGIGNPERFFESLRTLGIVFASKIFPDHHTFQKKDFDFMKHEIIIMTEKDAVKCRAFSDENFYMARGHASIDKKLIAAAIEKLKKQEYYTHHA